MGSAVGSASGAIGGLAHRVAENRRQKKEAEERAVQAEAERRARLREAAYAAASATCPLPLTVDDIDLPGGLRLFDDEFVVAVAKDWGITTKKLILTTHRLIHAKGTFVKDQEIVNLTDVADVNFHKSMLMPGDLEIETAGGHSLTGLPFARKSKELRNQLLELVNWAKNRANNPMVMMAPPIAAAAAPAAPDRYEQLRKLGELRAAGILNDQEFEAEKARIMTAG